MDSWEMAVCTCGSVCYVLPPHINSPCCKPLFLTPPSACVLTKEKSSWKGWRWKLNKAEFVLRHTGAGKNLEKVYRELSEWRRFCALCFFSCKAGEKWHKPQIEFVPSLSIRSLRSALMVTMCFALHCSWLLCRLSQCRACVWTACIVFSGYVAKLLNGAWALVLPPIISAIM